MPIKIEIDVMDSKEPRKFMVDEPYTSPAITSVHYLIHNGYVNPEDVLEAHIKYDTYNGLPLHPDCEDYPLRVNGKDFVLYVGGVSAGYGGEGPHGTACILELLGFNLSEFEEEQIYSKKTDLRGNPVTQVRLDFYK